MDLCWALGCVKYRSIMDSVEEEVNKVEGIGYRGQIPDGLWEDKGPPKGLLRAPAVRILILYSSLGWSLTFSGPSFTASLLAVFLLYYPHFSRLFSLLIIHIFHKIVLVLSLFSFAVYRSAARAWVQRGRSSRRADDLPLLRKRSRRVRFEKAPRLRGRRCRCLADSRTSGYLHNSSGAPERLLLRIFFFSSSLSHSDATTILPLIALRSCNFCSLLETHEN